MEVILSAPALEQFGKGSQTTPPQPLEQPCQFDTCPAGSPAFGDDPSDRESLPLPLCVQSTAAEESLDASPPELRECVPVSSCHVATYLVSLTRL